MMIATRIGTSTMTNPKPQPTRLENRHVPVCCVNRDGHRVVMLVASGPVFRQPLR